MNDKGVHRTAPATPGLLKNATDKKLDVLLYINDIRSLNHCTISIDLFVIFDGKDYMIFQEKLILLFFCIKQMASTMLSTVKNK